jgi:hypothetical protein
MSADIVAKMAKYRDKFGLITQANGDGGDTANRVAHYYTALHALNLNDDEDNVAWLGLAHASQKLARDNGRYRRHPDATKWYSDVDNMTRDQMAPLEAAFAFIGFDATLKKHIKARLKRGLLHFSTRDQGVSWKLPDLPSPLELAVLIRGLQLQWLYPLLYILDAFMLLETATLNANNVREGQILLYLAVALKHETTVLSKLALKIIARKQALLTSGLTRYYMEGPSQNGIEPLGELMVLMMRKMTQNEKV